VLLVVLVVVAVISFVIAALVIGREARALGATRRRPVYRLEDAVDAVAERLPFETAAQLTHDDVRLLLRWHLNALQFERGAILGDELESDGPPLVVSDRDIVGGLARRARAEGVDIATIDIVAVVDAHLAYLADLGAIDPVDGSPEGRTPADRPPPG
jgi:hypothetical protein